MAALREEGVDFVIALAHLGVDRMSTITSDALAAEVEGIDLIIDGHSHTEMVDGEPLDTSIELEEHGDTLIASTGAYIENIGVVTIDEDGALTAALVNEDDYSDRDEETAAVIAGIEAEQEPILAEVIGEMPWRLEGEREAVRARETNLGNLIADGYLEATGADVALMNGGSIRASIEAGDVTRRDIITVFPFGNYVLTVEITGADLLAAMEHGVADWPEPSPAFPHIGGMTFTLNAAAEPGSRVQDMMVGDEALDEEKTYVLALDDYLAGGGDDFSMFEGLDQLEFYGALDDMMSSYIASSPPVGEEAAGRLRIDEDGLPAAQTPPAGQFPAAEAPAGQSYLVAESDSLWAIAEQRLGGGLRWQEIRILNSPAIADPNLIYPGQVLQLPAA